MKKIMLYFALLLLNVNAEVSFTKDVRPILSDKCFACHGFDEETRDADLRLDTFAGAVADLGGYQAVVPGDPDKSELIKRIITHDEDDIMPPKGDRLTDAEVNILKEWIRQGAEYKKHWAYERIEQSLSPKVESDWTRSPIDKFINKKLPKGLKNSSDADPAILLRRASLDLTGLPPAVEDVLAFEKNPTDEAFEKYIDKLLASKKFGERWAVFWLDLARYGDSNGYQHDQRRTVWPYRDWVIKALNDNMPFDQFTIEQVAGDLLPNPTRKQLLATGFNRCGTVNLAGGSKPEETRYDLAKDRVNTIGTVYLGATLECAQCHNHKYDPISQKEYYQLLAYFRPAADRTYALSGRGTKKRVFGGELMLDNYPIDQPDHDEFTQEILGHAAETVKTKRLSDLIIQGRLKKDPEMDYVKISKKLNKKADMLVGQYDQNAPYRAWIMQDVAKPDKTYVLKRGSYLTPGEEVQAGTPEVLHAINGERSSNRLELARWLIDRENPLTARVMVNRFWNELFGRGIVTTTEDFGYQGALPSHPQLLDWLAAEFMKDWSIKGILKTIVLSSTYRQGSAKGQALNIDPENIYLSSGPRNRLSAEMIRDNLLGISGLLSAKMGGVPVYPPQPKGLWDEILDNHDKVYPTSTGEDVYRRSVYIIWRRGSLFPGFSIFDAPARNACVSHRTRTNSPLQALVTMNEPVLVEAAVALAHKIKDYSGSLDEKIIWAFRKCLARAPQAEELDILKKLYEENKITAREVVTKDKTGANKYEENDFLLSASSEVVPWFYVAHTLMNLDEVIRKR